MMRVVHPAAAVATFAAALFATGCAGDLNVSTASQRIIDGPPSADVLAEAAVLLRREFGSVSVDRAAGRVASDPVEFNSEGDSGTARDLVGASSRMRRTATCALVARENGALVQLRIDVERQDTSRRALAAPRDESYDGDDRPAYTPIERDAATTDRQNTVWTFVRRDRQLERQLLDELADSFDAAGDAAPRTSSAPAAAATP